MAKLGEVGLRIVEAERVQAVTVGDVLSDPAASGWIKDALRGAVRRDPVDAARDAELLAELLAGRCRLVLGRIGRGEHLGV